MILKNTGPVVVIEDDADDKEILIEVFNELRYPNEIVFFQDGDEALAYLNKTDIVPFLILSDINMPKLDGFQLRDKIKTDAKLEMKCIPYLFFTTASSQMAVIDAYSASAQGFFIKQNTYNELKEVIDIIMKYWLKCSSPNNF
ncbi:response regulator [Flaviaesturariibacter aridisoli]|uniref:Response regulator n=2 Tax=Flaviaesturariibacter aridisoli TaxID=2545761 RepID=A0A4R4DT60_9BACT|nr:response regulator [Flaviaesturariibacter aridisoli]